MEVYQHMTVTNTLVCLDCLDVAINRDYFSFKCVAQGQRSDTAVVGLSHRDLNRHHGSGNQTCLVLCLLMHVCSVKCILKTSGGTISHNLTQLFLESPD